MDVGKHILRNSRVVDWSLRPVTIKSLVVGSKGPQAGCVRLRAVSWPQIDLKEAGRVRWSATEQHSMTVFTFIHAYLRGSLGMGQVPCCLWQGPGAKLSSS